MIIQTTIEIDEGIQSHVSSLMRGGGQITARSSTKCNNLQQNAGIQDPQQATQYTQQALEMMNEHANTIHRNCIYYLAI